MPTKLKHTKSLKTGAKSRLTRTRKRTIQSNKRPSQRTVTILFSIIFAVGGGLFLYRTFASPFMLLVPVGTASAYNGGTLSGYGHEIVREPIDGSTRSRTTAVYEAGDFYSFLTPQINPGRYQICYRVKPMTSGAVARTSVRTYRTDEYKAGGQIQVDGSTFVVGAYTRHCNTVSPEISRRYNIQFNVERGKWRTYELSIIPY